VKFLLSFPQYTLLFQKILSETTPAQKKISEEIEGKWLNRITAYLPVSLYDSQINNLLLIRSPLLIFHMVTSSLNVKQSINADEPIYLDAKELVAVCTNWVEKLKTGL